MDNVKEYQYPNLDNSTPDELYKRRRDLCEELETVTAQLSGRLIESALECARLRSINEELITAGLEVKRVLSHIKDITIANPFKYVPYSAYNQAYEKMKKALERARM
jgi:hypothetical protein